MTAAYSKSMEVSMLKMDAAALTTADKPKLTFSGLPREVRLQILKNVFPGKSPKKKILSLAEMTIYLDNVRDVLSQMVHLLAAASSLEIETFTEDVMHTVWSAFVDTMEDLDWIGPLLSSVPYDEYHYVCDLINKSGKLSKPAMYIALKKYILELEQEVLGTRKPHLGSVYVTVCKMNCVRPPGNGIYCQHLGTLSPPKIPILRCC